MSMAVLIGVDVGSSGAKAVALGTDGQVLSQGRADYDTLYPRTGWAEQDPGDWFDGACGAIRSCLAAGEVHSEDVLGIAFVGPAHNVALLDRNDRLLRPCIH
jgi:xylulokinase